MGLGISKKEFRMMAVLLSGAFLAVLNATLMTPALPTIMGDMGVDSTTVQWLTSGYALTKAVVIIIALFQAALIGMETIMPPYIQSVLGHTATVSGIAMLPGAVIGAFTGLFAGRLFDKHGVRRPVLAGGAGITVGLIGFVSLQIDTPIVAVAVVYAVMAIGMQFTMTPVNTWGVNSLPNDAIQHAQSTGNTMNQVAASFGTALLVSVAATVSANTTSLTGLENTFFGYHAAFCITALLAGMAVVLIVALVRDGKRAKAGAACVRDAATMGQVVELIAATDTTGVSVVDGDGKLVGYVTDGDIIRYLARLDMSVSNPSVGASFVAKDVEDLEQRISALGGLNVMELATRRVVSVDVNTPLDVACGVLAKRKIKKVPVTRDGVLMGALSRRNILHAIITGEQPGN